MMQRDSRMMEMDQIIKGLESCAIRYCDDCPYDDKISCADYLCIDAAELIKEQRQMIKELKEMSNKCNSSS